MTDAAYAPPNSGFDPQRPSTPGIWRVLGITIGLVNLLVWYANGLLNADSSGGSAAYSAGYAAGYAVSGVFWPAVVALLFRIGKRFRNPRSGWKIFVIVSVLFLLAGLSNLAVKAVATAQRSVDATSVTFLD